MITGKLSLLLHLGAIFGVFLLLAITVLTLSRGVLMSWLQPHAPDARRRLLWLIAALPYLTALLAVTFVMLPSIKLALFATDPATHVHTGPDQHLCWYHPLSFKLLSWQSVLLLAMATFVLQALVRAATSTLLLQHKTARLLEFAESSATGYLRVDSDIPCAVTLGFWQPRSLISSAIETALSPQELTVVATHEAEHVRNRDPLKQFLFRLLAGIFPVRTFIDAMELAVEQCADLAVATSVRDRGLIAATILKVRSLCESSSLLIAGTGVTGFGGSVLEQRIVMLLSRRQGLRFPALKLALIAMAVIAAGLLADDSTHHIVERLLDYKH